MVYLYKLGVYKQTNRPTFVNKPKLSELSNSSLARSYQPTFPSICFKYQVYIKNYDLKQSFQISAAIPYIQAYYIPVPRSPLDYLCFVTVTKLTTTSVPVSATNLILQGHSLIQFIICMLKLILMNFRILTNLYLL